MRIIRPVRPLALALVICAGAAALPYAQQSTDTVTVPLTDPSRPGSVRVSLISGSIVVKGGDRSDILVTTRGRDGRPRQRSEPPPGFQRLSSGGGISITEQNNEVTIGGGAFRPTDIEIQVPVRTNLQLSAINTGDVAVENVDGEIEVGHMNGSVRLTNVAGTVVANSHNGNVLVTLTRLAGNQPMAFTSFNGNVDVTLPRTVKANLKMRSDNGDIFTDFEVQLQPTPGAQSTARNGRRQIDLNRSIYGTVNGGGPEFELRTFNGNIYVRRGAQ